MMRQDLLPVTFEGKLDRIIEECSEVIKAICKLRKHGEHARDPITNIEYDNIADMLNEMDDVEDAFGRAREHLIAGRQIKNKLSAR
jgi:hypothetical protein